MCGPIVGWGGCARQHLNLLDKVCCMSVRRLPRLRSITGPARRRAPVATVTLMCELSISIVSPSLVRGRGDRGWFLLGNERAAPHGPHVGVCLYRRLSSRCISTSGQDRPLGPSLHKCTHQVAADRVVLSLQGGDMLDFSQLVVESGGRAQEKIRKQWLHRLRSMAASSGEYGVDRVSLLDLLQHTAGEAKLAALVCQIIHRISRRFEALVAHRIQTAGHPRNTPQHKLEVSWADASPADFDWVAKLPAYLLGGVAATELDQELSLSTDKAWVGGLPIQNTSFLTQAGVAIVGIPVVPPSGKATDHRRLHSGERSRGVRGVNLDSALSSRN